MGRGRRGRSKTWIGEVEEMGGDPSSRKRRRHFGAVGGLPPPLPRSESYLFSKEKGDFFVFRSSSLIYRKRKRTFAAPRSPFFSRSRV